MFNNWFKTNEEENPTHTYQTVQLLLTGQHHLELLEGTETRRRADQQQFQDHLFTLKGII
jgi:hypothetical protein